VQCWFFHGMQEVSSQFFFDIQSAFLSSRCRAMRTGARGPIPWHRRRAVAWGGHLKFSQLLETHIKLNYIILWCHFSIPQEPHVVSD
jgi:hypothetical protein